MIIYKYRTASAINKGIRAIANPCTPVIQCKQIRKIISNKKMKYLLSHDFGFFLATAKHKSKLNGKAQSKL